MCNDGTGILRALWSPRCPLDREATERQIEQDRKKRMEIENRKKQELDDERSRLANWQKGMAQGAGKKGPVEDDSDYESEGEAPEEVPSASSEPMPDHPDYHGKGWQRR